MRRDAGASLVEYGSVLLLVAAIVTVFFSAGISTLAGNKVKQASCAIFQAGDCGGDGAAAAGQSARRAPPRTVAQPQNAQPNAQRLAWRGDGGDSTRGGGTPCWGWECQYVEDPYVPLGTPTAAEIEEFKDDVRAEGTPEDFADYSDQELLELVSDPEVAGWLWGRHIMPVVDTFRDPCTDSVVVLPCAEADRNGYDYGEIFSEWMESDVVPAVVISATAFEFWMAGGAAALDDDVWTVELNSNTTVLGKYPDYLRLGRTLNAHTFHIPEDLWRQLSVEEQWALNHAAIDYAVARGNVIQLSNSALNPRNLTGGFGEEISYLQRVHHYTISPDGYRMLPPGG